MAIKVQGVEVINNNKDATLNTVTATSFVGDITGTLTHSQTGINFDPSSGDNSQISLTGGNPFGVANIGMRGGDLTFSMATGGDYIFRNTFNNGVTIDPTGTVSATSFVGDGSQLTNLPVSGQEVASVQSVGGVYELPLNQIGGILFFNEPETLQITLPERSNAPSGVTEINNNSLINDVYVTDEFGQLVTNIAPRKKARILLVTDNQNNLNWQADSESNRSDLATVGVGNIIEDSEVEIITEKRKVFRLPDGSNAIITREIGTGKNIVYVYDVPENSAGEIKLIRKFETDVSANFNSCEQLTENRAVIIGSQSRTRLLELTNNSITELANITDDVKFVMSSDRMGEIYDSSERLRIYDVSNDTFELVSDTRVFDKKYACIARGTEAYVIITNNNDLERSQLAVYQKNNGEYQLTGTRSFISPGSRIRQAVMDNELSIYFTLYNSNDNTTKFFVDAGPGVVGTRQLPGFRLGSLNFDVNPTLVGPRKAVFRYIDDGEALLLGINFEEDRTTSINFPDNKANYLSFNYDLNTRIDPFNFYSPYENGQAINSEYIFDDEISGLSEPFSLFNKQNFNGGELRPIGNGEGFYFNSSGSAAGGQINPYGLIKFNNNIETSPSSAVSIVKANSPDAFGNFAFGSRQIENDIVLTVLERISGTDDYEPLATKTYPIPADANTKSVVYALNNGQFFFCSSFTAELLEIQGSNIVVIDSQSVNLPDVQIRLRRHSSNFVAVSATTGTAGFDLENNSITQTSVYTNSNDLALTQVTNAGLETYRETGFVIIPDGVKFKRISVENTSSLIIDYEDGTFRSGGSLGFKERGILQTTNSAFDDVNLDSGIRITGINSSGQRVLYKELEENSLLNNIPVNQNKRVRVLLTKS